MTKEERKEYMREWRKKHPEYMREYAKNNKEKKKEYDKKYYELHLEERRDYGRKYGIQYHQEHKEEHKKYYQDNKEKIDAYRKERREELIEYNREYRNTKNGKAVKLKLNYVHSDKQKKFDTDQNIDENWIVEHIFGASCIYCGETDWQKLGADRIDNSKPHTPDNCVCSCEKCNKQRGDKYSVEEFVLIKKKEKGGA